MVNAAHTYCLMLRAEAFELYWLHWFIQLILNYIPLQMTKLLIMHQKLVTGSNCNHYHEIKKNSLALQVHRVLHYVNCFYNQLMFRKYSSKASALSIKQYVCAVFNNPHMHSKHPAKLCPTVCFVFAIDLVILQTLQCCSSANFVA